MYQGGHYVKVFIFPDFPKRLFVLFVYILGHIAIDVA